MGDMKDHVVSRPVAEKLKGYLPSLFKSYDFWYYDNGKKEWLLARGDIALRCLCGTPLDAPILEEMFELLPKYIEFEEGKFELRTGLSWTSQYRIGYYNSDNSIGKYLVAESPNLSTAAAKLYMHLVDNKHIEVKK